MWLQLKSNVYLFAGLVFAGLLAALKVMSTKGKAKDSQIEQLKASISTTVEVNKTNVKSNEVIHDIKESRRVVDAMPDDDIDRLLLDKYTRNNSRN